MIRISSGLITRYGSIARRIGWGLGDQALSSLTNFLLGILVATTVSVRQFGVFGIAFATYTFALGVSRSIVAEPLAIRFSNRPQAVWSQGTRVALGAVLVVGVLIGSACVLMSLFFDGSLANTLLALGTMMPLLLLQDSLRYASFAAGQGRQAFSNDLVWAAIMIPSIGFGAMRGWSSVTVFVLVWSGSAAVAAVTTCFMIRLLPDPSRAKQWWRDQRDLIPPLLGDFLLMGGTNKLTVYGIATFAGLEVTGAIRGAHILLGPLNIIFMGIRPVAIREAVRVAQQSGDRLRRGAIILSVGLSASAIMLGLAMLTIPSSIGRSLLGGTWESARGVVFIVALSEAAGAANTGAMVGMRALGSGKRLFKSRLFAGPFTTLSSIAGAVIAGAPGAVGGGAAATSITDIVWWRQFGAAMRESTGPEGVVPALPVDTVDMGADEP